MQCMVCELQDAHYERDKFVLEFPRDNEAILDTATVYVCEGCRPNLPDNMRPDTFWKKWLAEQLRDESSERLTAFTDD